MKKIICSCRFNHKFLKAFTIVKENKIVTLLVLLLVCGVIVGSICIGLAGGSFSEDIDSLFLQNYSIVKEHSYFSVYSSSFLSGIIFIIICFFAAVSLPGVAVLPIVLIFKGLGVGITAGHIYSHYGLKGIAFYILVLLPGAFLSGVVLVIYERKSICFSHKVFCKFFRNSNPDKLWPDFKVYIKSTGKTMILCAVVSALDAMFYSVFGGLFSF